MKDRLLVHPLAAEAARGCIAHGREILGVPGTTRIWQMVADWVRGGSAGSATAQPAASESKTNRVPIYSSKRISNRFF